MATAFWFNSSVAAKRTSRAAPRFLPRARTSVSAARELELRPIRGAHRESRELRRRSRWWRLASLRCWPTVATSPERSSRFAFDGNDPFRGGGDGVAAEMHRRGAGMIGAADKREFDAALAGDGFDDAERQPELFENRALLDVKFQDSRTYRPSQRACGISAGFNPNFRWPRERKFPRASLRSSSSFIEPANERAAADERHAEANAFFFGKADDFDCERETSPLERFQQGDRKNDSENAVIRAGVRNGIEMRADEQARRAGFAAG